MVAVREAVSAVLDELEEVKALRDLKDVLAVDSPCTVQTLRKLLGDLLVALQEIVAKKVEEILKTKDAEDGDENGDAGAVALLGGLGAAALNALVEKVCVKVQKACDPLLHKVALTLSAHRKRTTQRSVEKQPLLGSDVEKGMGQMTEAKCDALWVDLLRGIKAALEHALDVKIRAKLKGFTAGLLNKTVRDGASLGALRKCADKFEAASCGASGACPPGL